MRREECETITTQPCARKFWQEKVTKLRARICVRWHVCNACISSTNVSEISHFHDHAAMTTPVLVRAYRGDFTSTFGGSNGRGRGAQGLPPISAYAFKNILRDTDSPEFQQAITGIAEICAKNRMSLADEYASHLPPLGEITAANSATARPHLARPGMRTALTSVPEASSGSSEGSRRSKKRKGGLFGFRKKEEIESQPMRKMRIGSMGRSVPVSGTTAVTDGSGSSQQVKHQSQSSASRQTLYDRRIGGPSEAVCSLQRVLSAGERPSGQGG